MRYYALAADYDGTLAHDGHVDEPTWAALKRLKASGRKLLIVSGRELDELLGIIADKAELFDRIVAENGAVVYHPATKEVHTIGTPPPERFVAELRDRLGIAADPDRAAPHGPRLLAVGRVIVATWEPHQQEVLAVIRELGLEMQVVFNKGAVMVLPSGVNKATGLAAALADLGLSPHNVVGVGDAENDHAMLAMCECGVAVSNALPAVKETADVVTRADHGAGVAELVDHLLADDLARATAKLARHHIRVGTRADGTAEMLDPHAAGVMVCGTSGSGKSTLTTGLLERLAGAGYQLAVIDPEGDYTTLGFAVVLGSPQRAPLVAEVVDLLRDPTRNAVVNLLGVALEHRPGFFAELLPALLDLRARTGRPHWLVVDETHHLLPASWEPAHQTVPAQLRGLLSITVHPGSVSPAVLANVDTVLAVGGKPQDTIKEFCAAARADGPTAPAVDMLTTGDAVLWRVGSGEAVRVTTDPPKTERTRHSRKYAEGNLGPARSFFFRGPEGKLNLKAHNLLLFVQMADGVDDETWSHHLKNHDYSNWLRHQVKDDDLAAEVAEVEANTTLAPAASKAAVRAAVEGRYTLPADKPSGVID